MNELYKTIIFFGKPGCGKGAPPRTLHDAKLGFHLSTGEIFRNVDKTTNLGRYVKNLIDAGRYVDSETTLVLIKQTIDRYVREGLYDPNTQYLLLDGFPRTVEQVEMTKNHFDIVKVLHLYIPEEVAIQRLRERGKTSGREDDKKEAILLERMATYNQETAHLLSRYPNKYDIDTSPSIEEVHRNILSVLEYYL